MSAAVADRLFDRDEHDGSSAARRRWGVCFALIAALHLAGVWAALHWHWGERPAPLPPPAIIIDLPPLPRPPAARPRPIPPPPKPAVVRPALPKLVVQPNAPPAPAAPRIAVPLPPQPKPPERPIVNEEPATVRPDERPAVVATAPPVAEASPAPTVAPRAPVAAAPANPNAVPTWQGLLIGRLQQFKRYPSSAQQRRQQGIVYLRFTMDRRGKVASASIERSSGFSALDDETLALIHRAEPLPPPPPELPGDPVELVVPVQFFLRDR